MEASEDIFISKLDPYNGVTIPKELLPDTKEKFTTMLENSIKKWKEIKVRGIWLNIGIDKSEYISIAAKAGFIFHHAKPDYVLMTHWLSDEASHLPHYASHYIGVGGAVVNDKNEILVIQERVKTHDLNPWKIPGGLVDANEFIPEAAVREVWEETGVKTEFVSLIALRETKSWKFGQNDIYFVGLMKPVSSDIKIDPQEIKTSKWMPIEEFCAQPSLIETQRRIAMLASLKLNKIEIGEGKSEDLLDLISMTPQRNEFRVGSWVRDQIFYSCENAVKLVKPDEKIL